jgi:ankyrin repeat protein
MSNKINNKILAFDAIKKGDIKTVKEAIEIGLDVNTINQVGNSLLFVAANQNKNEVVKFLIEKGANINFQNKSGITPLMAAITSSAYLRQNLELINILINSGADLNITNKNGEHSLHIAILSDYKNNMFDIIKLLIEKGVDLNIISTLSGYNPLTTSINKKNIEVAKLLIEKGANIDFQNDNGISPLMVAIAGNLYELIKLLIYLNVNIDNKTIDGDTPLIFAVKYKNPVDIINLLLEKGADPSIKNNDGNNALYYAIQNKNKDIINILSKFGTNFMTHRNSEIEDLKKKAKEIWKVKGPICDLKGFHQHIGECVNDSVQMLMVSSDKIKEKVQFDIIHKNYDDVNFSDYKPRFISAELLKVYVQAFQSRFVRHYLNEDMICSRGEEEVKKILYRSKGLYSTKAHLTIKKHNTHPMNTPFTKKYIEEHDNTSAGLTIQISLLIIKLLCNVFEIKYNISELKYFPNFTTNDSFIFNIVNKDDNSKRHAMCFYKCGKKEFVYDNNRGPLRFEWSILLNILIKKSFKNIELVFSNMYNYTFYPSLLFTKENIIITIDPYKNKLIEMPYMLENEYTLISIFKLEWIDGITENNKIEEIQEPTRARLPNIPLRTKTITMNNENVKKKMLELYPPKPSLTIIFDAIYENNIETIDKLLREGIDVNMRDKYQNTPLMIASAYGKIGIVKRLLKAGADTSLVNKEGKSAKDLASINKHKAIVDIFVKRNTTRNVSNGGRRKVRKTRKNIRNTINK